MKTMILMAGLVAVAGQASALSCMQPDVARSFTWAAEAEESYSVFMGTFRYAEPVPPRDNLSNNPIGFDIVARFSGQGLGANGFGAIEPVDVTIAVQCAGPWCGGPPPSDTTTLAFVERTSDGYVLRADPCNGMFFSPVRVEDVGRVEACMRGEGCEEQPFR